jgi:hypothetical protein
MMNDESKAGTSDYFIIHHSAFIISKDRVNERGERRRLREDEQDAEQQQDDDDRQKPEFLVLPQEQPDLTGERELAHIKTLNKS